MFSENKKHSKVLKVLSFILCVLAIGGCAGGSGGGTATDSSAVVDSGAVADDGMITLVKNGETQYTVVRPDGLSTDTATVQQTIAIRKNLNEYVSSGSFGITDDFEKYPDDACMIYIGAVDNEEADRLAGETSYGEYSVTVKGKSIYIYATDDSSLEKAADRFMDIVAQHVTENEDGTKTIEVPVTEMNDGKHSAGTMTALPSVDGSKCNTNYTDVYNRNYLFLSGVSLDELNAYEEKLKTAGFTSFYKKKTQSQIKEYFYDATTQVELSYNGADDYLTIISQPKEGSEDIPTFYALCLEGPTNVYKTAAKTDVAVEKVKYEVLTVVSTQNSDFYEVSGEGDGKYVSAADVEVYMSLSELKAGAAVEWGRDIAADDEFHYGYSTWAHHHGCYFCGTNSATGKKCADGAAYEDQLKSYCCNPFVTACFCHGAGAVTVGVKVSSLVNCKSSRINLANDSNTALQNTKYWMEIEVPSSMAELLPGDILLTPTHAMLYSGSGNILEASGGDDNVKNSAKWNNSIHEASGSSKFKNVTKVYRYIGK